jgi:hypothetical protein
MQFFARAKLFVVAGLVVACGAALGGCGRTPERMSHATARGGVSTIFETHDPRTANALLQIARDFNNDYQQNKDAAVYQRWDAPSRAIISEPNYLRRHEACPNDASVKVNTWGVTHGPGGAWLVHYSIDGQQLTDWWYFLHGRFVFDLARSNPSAVSLYRDSPAKYMQLTGCGA